MKLNTTHNELIAARNVHLDTSGTSGMLPVENVFDVMDNTRDPIEFRVADSDAYCRVSDTRRPYMFDVEAFQSHQAQPTDMSKLTSWNNFQRAYIRHSNQCSSVVSFLQEQPTCRTMNGITMMTAPPLAIPNTDSEQFGRVDDCRHRSMLNFGTTLGLLREPLQVIGSDGSIHLWAEQTFKEYQGLLDSYKYLKLGSVPLSPQLKIDAGRYNRIGSEL